MMQPLVTPQVLTCGEKHYLLLFGEYPSEHLCCNILKATFHYAALL